MKIIQREEITAYFIYNKLANREKDPHNKDILTKIAEDEMDHYNTFKGYTKEEVKP